MGEIITSRMREDGKIVFEIAVDYEEALQLNGHMNKVHVFSENIASIDSNISQRGRNEATKYFLIAKQLRFDLKFDEQVTCQKIDTGSKIFFIYCVEKKED